MTVPTSTSKSGPYSANGSVVDYTGTFPLLEEDQIRVVHTNAAGAETDLSLGSEYSVAPTGGTYPAPTFTVTTVNTYLTGEKITIVREMPFTQETAYGNSGPYLPEIHEASYDENTMESQQLLEQYDRSLKVPVSSDASPDDILNDLINGGPGQSNVKDVVDIGSIAGIRDISVVPAEVQSGTLDADAKLSFTHTEVGKSKHTILRITSSGSHYVAVGQELKWLGSPPDDTATWQATTPYGLGAYAKSLVGDQYECTTAGTTGGSEPSWNTSLEAITADGTVVWTRRNADVLLIENGFQANFDILSVGTDVFISGGVEDEGAVIPIHAHPQEGVVGLLADLEALNVDIAALNALPHPTTDQEAAMDAANSPSGANAFATVADVTPLSPNTPTSDEKAALAGTDGSPSAANKYVTNSDSRLAGGLSADNLMWVRDETAQGTAKTTLTAATQNIRVINTEKHNSISGASLGGNKITLPAGTYTLDISVRYRSEGNVGGSILSLWDDTASSYIDHATDYSDYDFTGVDHSERPASLSIRFTLPATRDLEIHHYVASNSDTGEPCNVAGFTETRLNALIFKER